MKTERIKKLLCLLCLAVGTVAMAQSESPSILDRVQNVDEPELAELIRVAIEHRENLDQKEILEITRNITLSYVQVKLLDQQIAEVSRKIKAQTGPEEMRYELLLARTELESRLMTELANLREIMGIIPKHAFDKKPIESLSSWVFLRVLKQGVYVLDTLHPFQGWWGRSRYRSLGLQSEKEALDYVQKRLKDPNNLPIRIDLYHMAEMSNAAKNLHGKVVSLIRKADCQMEAEVSLKLIIEDATSESRFFIRNGTISTLHPGGDALARPDGGPKRLATGVVEPNDLDQHILRRLLDPSNVPLKILIEHDEASSKPARHVTDRVRTIAKDLGISEVVEVERILVEAVPESDFLGRWQAITRGDIQTIDIQPTGVCVFMQSPGAKLIKSGISVPGKWFLTPKEIFMDIKDQQGRGNYIYRGYPDREGNLVVEKGQAYLKGNFVIGVPHPTIFKKEY